MSNDSRRLLVTALTHHQALYGNRTIIASAPTAMSSLPAPVLAETSLATVADAEDAPPVDTPPKGPSPEGLTTEPNKPSENLTAIRANSAPAMPFPPRTPEADDPAALDPYARIAALIPPESPLHGLTTLDELQAFVRDTVLIPLDETRLNPVFGVGSPTADLMVIGEAPGADEDKQGEPFVGRAGKLLTEILKAIGFERSDVYIANILKSRPPNNRDPLAEETAAHIPILYRQISLIQPRLLLCVGRTSGTAMLGRQSTLKAMRGVFHDYHGLELMVTYHPAALLRNSNWKRPTWEDVKLLRRRYDELTGATSTTA